MNENKVVFIHKEMCLSGLESAHSVFWQVCLLKKNVQGTLSDI